MRATNAAATGELADKQERVTRALAEGGHAAVLLAAHHNIAWVTGGRGDRIGASRETGPARLLVTADGRRFALANAIEMPRMRDEVLAGLPFEPIEYPWTDDQDPGHAVGVARTVLDPGATIAADWPLPGTAPFESAIARTRALLTGAELDSYRAYGREAGRVVGDACRALTPGQEEREIARQVADALAATHGRPVVLLVAAAERLRRYRHPVPTDTRWHHVVLVAVCAERDGQVVALSRIVATRGAPADLDTRTRATAAVFGRLLDASRPGATGAALYDAAARAYAAEGFPAEELKHHQGGAIGYRARDWVAHPRSTEIVQARQAFAWNPSITGTKVEDTALVVDGRVELITSTPGWPSIEMSVQGGTLLAADVLRV